MVVHYARTVWKNKHAGHEEAGTMCNRKKMPIREDIEIKGNKTDKRLLVSLQNLAFF